MFTHAEIWQAIDALAKNKGWPTSRLATHAGLDPTSLNPSKRMSRDGKPRWPSTETVNKLLSATGTSVAEFCEGMKPHRSNEASSLAQILLIDDDESFCEASAAILRAAGYGIRVSNDHRKLDLVEEGQKVDLLCTDIVMPDGLGAAAIACMARLRRPELKILYITAYDIPGLELNRNTRLARKPLGGNALLDEVASLLGGDQPR